MRAAPPLTICVARFGVWRGLVSLICASAAATAAAEVLTHLESPAWLAGTMAAAALGGCLAGWRSRRSPVSLRWDGKAWWSDAVNGPDGEPRSCQLEVMIDAGNWLMLRLKPDGGPSAGRFSWLPVQCWGLQGHWHALRTAIYSPQPVKEEAAMEVPLHE